MHTIALIVRATASGGLARRLAAFAEAEHGRGLPWLAVAAIGGVLGEFSLAFEPAVWTGPGALLLGLAAAALTRRSMVARAVWLALAFGAAGFTSAQVATHTVRPAVTLPTHAVIVSGVVSAVEEDPEGKRLVFDHPSLSGGAPLARSIRVRLRPGDPAELRAGDVAQVRSVLRPPSLPSYPGARDPQRDAFFAGSAGSGFAIGAATGGGPAPGGGSALRRLREAIAARFVAGMPAPNGAIAAVLFTGLGAAIPPPDRDAYRASGLAHLLAVAGLHLGIVMGAIMAAARAALARVPYAALHWPCKAIAAWAALLGGGAYVLLTGAHIPVLRAYAMAALVTAGLIAGRRALSMRGLAIAALALVAAAPYEVLGVSFQMSFSAVLALIAGYEAARPHLARLRHRKALHHLVTLSLTSLLAGLASAPFGAYRFGHIQLYFVLANLLAVPLAATVILPCGLVALALMPLGLERFVLPVMSLGLDLTGRIAHGTADFPGATLDVPHIPAAGIALTAAGIAFLGLIRSRIRLAGLPVILLGLGWGLIAPPADLLLSGDGRIIALRDPAMLQTRPGFRRDVLRDWQQYWAETLSSPFPESGARACAADGCRLRLPGGAVVLARADNVADCDGIAVVISAERLRRACPDVPGIDRAALAQSGALAIWLRHGAASVLTDRQWQGDRPWSSHPALHGGTPRPMALTDDGP